MSLAYLIAVNFPTQNIKGPRKNVTIEQQAFDIDHFIPKTFRLIVPTFSRVFPFVSFRQQERVNIVPVPDDEKVGFQSKLMTCGRVQPLASLSSLSFGICSFLLLSIGAHETF